MNPMPPRDYRHLETDADRQALVADMRAVRKELLRVFDLVPTDRWYEPRYHGWSPAAMLGHLEFMDSALMFMVQSASLGLRVAPSTGMLHTMNDFLAVVFRRRLVETTRAGLLRKEERIAQFILGMPPERYDRLVYDPPYGVFLTVEQAIQEFFVYHWREHLETMRRVDDVGGFEPTAGSGAVV